VAARSQSRSAHVSVGSIIAVKCAAMADGAAAPPVAGASGPAARLDSTVPPGTFGRGRSRGRK
jgi:hypothetical protein